MPIIEAVRASTVTVSSTLGFLVVVTGHPPATTSSSVFDRRDVAIDGGQELPTVFAGYCLVEAVVVKAAGHHVGGSGSVVAAWLAIESLPLVAPVIDAFVSAVSLERRVCEVGPPLARVFHPFAPVKGAALRRAAALGTRGICALEPLLATPRHSVIVALGNHQVCVRIVLASVGVAPGVDRERVRQPFFRGQFLRERVGQGDLSIGIELTRQSEVCADIQSPVGALVHVRRVPVFTRVVLDPIRHVVRFRVGRRVAVRIVVLLAARDVLVRGAGAGSAATRARAEGEVITTAAAARSPATMWDGRISFEPLHRNHLSAKGARAKPFRRNAKVRLWPTSVVLQAPCPRAAAPLIPDRRSRSIAAGTAAASANRCRRSAMPQPEKVLARIHSLDERLARLRTEKNRLIARAGHAERKHDTRRKTLIGGAVLAAIDHEGVPVIRSVPELLRWLDTKLTRPHDRAAFDLLPR